MSSGDELEGWLLRLQPMHELQPQFDVLGVSMCDQGSLSHTHLVIRGW